MQVIHGGHNHRGETLVSSHFDRDLYEDLRKNTKIYNALPMCYKALNKEINSYVIMIAQRIKINNECLKEIVGNCTQAYRVATHLIQNHDSMEFYGKKDLDSQMAKIAGLQLILYAVFVQLCEWTDPVGNEQNTSIGKSLLEMKQLRNAAAHQGGDRGKTFFRFIPNKQQIAYSTREIRKTRDNEVIGIQDVVLGAFLYWKVIVGIWEHNNADSTTE